MSSQDLKVGDLCIVVAPAGEKYRGRECEIVGPHQVYEKRIASTNDFDMVAWCEGFLVRMTDNRAAVVFEAQCLRKKPPPAKFVEEFKREIARTPEHA